MNGIDIRVEGPVWLVTLIRPQARNAIDGPCARALADAFRRVDADPHARVAVLTRAGGLSAGVSRAAGWTP